MKVGDMVIHGNYSGSLRVKSISEFSVCVERTDEPKHTNIHGEQVYQVFIVSPENLRLASEQKTQAPKGTQLSLLP